MSTAVPADPLPLLQRENGRLREENAVLRASIAWLRQRLFGPGQSEKLDRAQLLLKLEELEKLAVVPASPGKEQISYEREKTAPAKRTLPAESFAHLPVRETVEIVPEPVKQAPTLYEKIGEERTFEVDLIPPETLQARDRPPEVSALPGPQPGAVARARAAARGRRRLRLRRPDRLGVDRKVLRSPAALSPGEDAGALGRADLPAEPLRLGGCGHRALGTAGQTDETGPAGRGLRAGR